jgi:NADPH-dependent glutamate synthase beta subunit-like oxidoreductase
MMEKNACPVYAAFREVCRVVAGRRIVEPRARGTAEDLAELLDDVSRGRAGAGHLAAMADLARRLAQGGDPEAATIGARVEQELHVHSEAYESHIRTRICPSGDCDVLAPAPCQMACPAGIDVSSYVSLIGQGRYGEAVSLIRQDNPFPWVCGLVCTHPCEFICVRGLIDAPVAIKDLKAFAAERAMSRHAYVNPGKAEDNGQKVCVIGAGPAGLTAAYFLALNGYRVTVIEALPSAGGMMRMGVPRYRLPAEVIDREVAIIERLGVEFRFNTRLGVEATLPALRAEGFLAFFIAVGAHASHRLSIPGEEAFPQVIDAVRFLREVALGHRRIPGLRVGVIGGGNVAIDAARTLVRLGCEEVLLLYRRTRNEMPANHEEIRQAEEEGVRLRFLAVPVEIIGAAGRVTGLRILRARLSDPDAQGRRRPVPIEGSDSILPLDAVIPAIGQKTDTQALQTLRGIRWTRWDTIVAHTVSMATDAEGIFAGGDAVGGPATVVEAIGAGKRAAEGIDRFLRGLPQPGMPPVPVRRHRGEWLEVPADVKMTLGRQAVRLLDPDRRRSTFEQVELGLSEDQARDEARRCLRCDVCKRCGRCVAVCRDSMGVDALRMGYVEGDRKGRTDYLVAAERCILCGACAANCPTGAMRIQEIDGERRLSLCGTILHREKLVCCEACGAALGSTRYLDFVRRRTAHIAPAFPGRRLCEACARKATAESSSYVLVQ